MIIIGDRDASFIEMITNTLKKSNIKPKYIEKIISSKYALNLYNNVFTHSSADDKNNYEWLEILGDATVNKCIVWYISNRFPQLNCTEGVKIIARLKINLISKKTFSEFAMKLDWWKFISAEEEIKQTKMKKILEDVFEAFFGATELIIDSIVYPGSGYSICYRLVASLFNDISISLSYESLYDPITRLKEVFDFFKNIGTFHFQNEKKEGFQHVTLYQHHNNSKYIIGFGIASLLDDAKQKACHHGLLYLKNRGIEKPIPEYYKQINDISHSATHHEL
jgi:dsRNA-specific ribonuclease